MSTTKPQKTTVPQGLVPPPPNAQQDVVKQSNGTIPPPPPPPPMTGVDTPKITPAPEGLTDCYITIFHSDEPIGKEFFTDANTIHYNPAAPELHKKSHIDKSRGKAETVYVPTPESLADVIRDVQNKENTALVMSYIPSTKPNARIAGARGPMYNMLPQAALRELMGITDQPKKNITKPFKKDGQLYGAKIKSLMTRSAWALWDADTNEDMPESIKQRMANEQYIDLLAEIEPAISGVDYVRTGSASARVRVDGKQMSSSNQHLFMLSSIPVDQPRVGLMMAVRSDKVGLGYWSMTRCPRTGEIQEDGPKTWNSIFDRATFSTARVSYEGRPTLRQTDELVKAGRVTVDDPVVEVVRGTKRVFNSQDTTNPTEEEINACGFSHKGTKSGYQIYNQDMLTPHIQIEVKHHDTGEYVGWITMREFAEGDVVRYRANNPFKRESTSWAALLSKADHEGKEIRPFLYSNEYGIYEYNDYAMMFKPLTGNEGVVHAPVKVPEEQREYVRAEVPVIIPMTEQKSVPTAGVIPPPPPPVQMPSENFHEETPAEAFANTILTPEEREVTSVPTQLTPVDMKNLPTRLPLLTLEPMTVPSPYKMRKDVAPLNNESIISTFGGDVLINNDNNDPYAATQQIVVGVAASIKVDDFPLERKSYNFTARTLSCSMKDEAVTAHAMMDSLFKIDGKTKDAVNALMVEKDLFCWTGKGWAREDVEAVKQCLYKSVPIGEMTSSQLNASLNLAMVHATRGESIDPLPNKYTPFYNGLFDWYTGRFKQHNRNYFYEHQAQLDYSPLEFGSGSAMKVFMDACNGDTKMVRRVLQMVGYSVAGGVNHQQRIMVFSGASRSGKSIIGKIISALQPQTLSSVVGDLSNKKTLNNLANTQVFMDDDAHSPHHSVKDAVSGMIKSVTSDAKLEVEQMYTTKLKTVQFPIKVVLICNDVPTFFDPQGAIIKRYEVVRFKKSVSKRQQDASLNEVLTNKRELAALFNLAVAGMQDLYTMNGFKSFEEFNESEANDENGNRKPKALRFAECDSSVELARELASRAEPLLDFLDSHHVQYAHRYSTPKITAVPIVRAWAEDQHIGWLAKATSKYIETELTNILYREREIELVDGMYVGVSIGEFFPPT